MAYFFKENIFYNSTDFLLILKIRNSKIVENIFPKKIAKNALWKSNHLLKIDKEKFYYTKHY